MNSQDKWLLQYAFPCIPHNPSDIEALPNIEKIRKFLNRDFSREKVRKYFLGPHNQEAYNKRNFNHMLFPYEIKKTIGRLEREFIKSFPEIPQQFKTKKIILPETRIINSGNRAYIHVGAIVDII